MSHAQRRATPTAVVVVGAPTPSEAANPFTALLAEAQREADAAAANPFTALLAEAQREADDRRARFAADAAAEAERQRGRVMCTCGDPFCECPGTDGYGLRPVPVRD